MANYEGIEAEKLPAIAKQRVAQGLQEHGLLAFLLVVHGKRDIVPPKYLEVFDNAPLLTRVETPLTQSKKNRHLGRTGPGQKFEYRIYRGGTDFGERRATVEARGTRIAFDATSDEERFQFVARRLPKAVARLGMVKEEVQGTTLNPDGVEDALGAAVIEILEGMAYELVLGDGTGNHFNGMADQCKPLMYFEGETDGTWTGKTIGLLDQNTYKTLRNRAYTTSVSDAKTTPENLLPFLGMALSYAARAGWQSRFGICARLTHANLQSVMRVAHAQQLAIGVTWNLKGNESLNILLGEHIFVNGAPIVVDVNVPANYIYTHNWNVLGIDWKETRTGRGPIQHTNLIKLDEVGSGYEIGTVGMQFEFHGNMVTCWPGVGTVISAFSG